MDSLTALIVPAVVFILTLIFGYWLSRLGKPYRGFIFNLHKLSALAAAVVAALPLIRALRGPAIGAAPILLTAAAAVCAAALFLTGALMSTEKLSYNVTRTIHRIATSAALAAAALATYLLWAEV